MKSFPQALANTPGGKYSVKGGALFLDGRKVGTVNANGDFQATGPDGKMHSGNIGKLIRSDVRRQVMSGGRDGPTGRMRVGAEGFDVRAGAVWLAGREVGHVNRGGDYELEVHGQPMKGNLNSTLGAVWLFSKKRVGTSARIKVGDHSLSAIDGVVYEGGEEVGWLMPDGRFRVVTLEGEHLEGRVQGPLGADKLGPRPLNR